MQSLTEEPTQDNMDIIVDIVEMLKEQIEGSNYNVDPETYFIWMYALEPFAEA